MAIVQVNPNPSTANCWDRIASLPSGHTLIYFPGNASPKDTLILYNVAGKEVARNADGLRGFSAAIEEGGEIVVTYIKFVDGSDRPIRRWLTGIKVPTATPPTTPPPATGNSATVAAIRLLLDEIV
jgi:hypothetical protein